MWYHRTNVFLQPKKRSGAMKGLLVGLAVMGILGGCLDLSESSSSSSSSSSCDQECVDGNTASAIINSTIFLYSSQFLGRSAGVFYDEIDTCPLGGTIHYMGSFTVGGDFQTQDLNYDMSGCGVSDSGYSLTYTGVLDYDGNFNINTGDNVATTYISTALTFSGTAFGSTVVESCAVNVVWSGTGSPSGAICGRTF